MKFEPAVQREEGAGEGVKGGGGGRGGVGSVCVWQGKGGGQEGER